MPSSLPYPDAASDAPCCQAIATERDRLLEIVSALGLVSSSPGTTAALMHATVSEAMRITRADGAVLELVDGADLEYRAAVGTVAGFLGLRLGAAGSLSGRCVAQRQVMYSTDTRQDPRVDQLACEKVAARSMLVVPLFRGSVAIGVLKAVATTPDAFDRIDEHALSLFARFIGGVIARQAETDTSHELAAEMERRALRDDLTGLPNRSAWIEELERGIARARRARAPLAVMYLDLDGFKAINDRYGHAAGDAVLRSFAGQLRACVRSTDFVARLAGDEFAVMAEGFTDVERDVPVVADKLIQAARAGICWEGHRLDCMPSIGIAYQNGPGYSAETLMRAADDAMYRAKQGRTLFTATDCTA